MLKKAIIREFIWIGAFLLISIIVVQWLAGFAAGDFIDVQIHDTYFVLPNNPITYVLWLWIALILIKYVLQGLLLLAKQNIVIACVLALILLITLWKTIFGMVQLYSNMHAAIPSRGDEFIEYMQRISLMGFVFYAIISAGLLTLLIFVIKEVIRKIRALNF